MKYLKRYNESDKWTENELRRDIDDILMELRDDGFTADVIRRGNWMKKGYNVEVIVRISKKFKFKEELSLFDYSLIKPTLDRLTEYMNGQGYVYEVIVRISKKFKHPESSFSEQHGLIFRDVTAYKKKY